MCILATVSGACAKTVAATDTTTTPVRTAPAIVATTIVDTTTRPLELVIGTSVQGRPLKLTRVGRGPVKVLWIGGIHGDEPEGKEATAALPDVVMADEVIAGRVTLLVLQDVNPDGRVAGTRTNAHGVDLNRNFPATNFDRRNPLFGGSPLSQPESKSLHDLIVTEQPTLIVACHGWRGASFVNFDGPGLRLASTLASESGLTLKRSSELREATPGSLGSWAGADLGIASITIEWLRGSDPLADWEEVRRGVVDILRHV